MSKPILYVLVALLLVTTAFTPQAQVQPLAPAGMSFVRVLHASPDAPNVDVYIDDVLTIENLAFSEITPYLSVTAGNHSVEVFATGTTTDPVIDVPALNLVSGNDYTIAAAGLLASIAPEVFVDDNTIVPGGASVRFIHLSPGAPNVDVNITGGTPDIFANVAFGEDAATYLTVPPGLLDLEVVEAGTTTVLLDVPGVPFAPNTVYTVFALGLPAGSPALSALLVADAGYANVRVVHGSPDAPDVDVLVDGAEVVTDLAFTEVTPYLRVLSGPHTVEVVEAGTVTPAVIDTTVNLLPNTDYTIAASGLLADIEAVVFTDDNTLPAEGMASVRFVHLSPNAPAVDVAVTGGAVLIPNTAFQAASVYVEVPAGTYNLEARATGTATVALAIPGVHLRPQTVYTVFAFGLAPGTPALSAVAVEDFGLSFVRAVHASPDAGNVDVYLDGVLVPGLVDVPFEAVSTYLELPSGPHQIQVTPMGDDSTFLIDEVVSLTPNMYHTAAARGLVAGPPDLALSLFVDDFSAPQLGFALVRLVQLSPDLTPVDVYEGSDELFDEVAYNTASAYMPVPAGTHDLVVRPAGTTTVVLDLTGVVFESGEVYSIFITGLAGGMSTLNAIQSLDAVFFYQAFPIMFR